MISLIIPVYNCEKYLSECLESVLSQTFADFELILIDDGSTDKSVEVCKKYQNLDKRIVFSQNPHQGIAKTRNSGIALAKGDYLCFVDSDDFLVLNMLELLHEAIVSQDTDMSMCRCNFVFNKNSNFEPEPENAKEVKLCTPDEALALMFREKDVNTFVFNKLFKKELFREIRFAEDVSCDDLATTYILATKAKFISMVDESLYFHCVRENSFGLLLNDDNELDTIKVCEDINVFVSTYYPHLSDAFAYKYFRVCLKFIHQITSVHSYNDKGDYLKLISIKLNELSQTINFKEVLSRYDFYMLKLLIKNPELYCKIYKFTSKFRKVEHF